MIDSENNFKQPTAMSFCICKTVFMCLPLRSLGLELRLEHIRIRMPSMLTHMSWWQKLSQHKQN